MGCNSVCYRGSVNWRIVTRAAGVVLIGIALALAVAAIVAAVYGEPAWSFFGPAIAVAGLGTLVLAVMRVDNRAISGRDGVLVVVFCWVAACVAGAFPFLLSGTVVTFADALFESASGFTTTGSTVFSDVESLPRSILFWRSFTHWLGGMGMIVLVVAVLPAFGIAGYKLVVAEAPGPDVERLMPKIAQTARVFWLIYAGITALEVVLLRLGGLSFFDAVNHSFATLATGGFSTRNASIAAFSPYVQVVITVFMVVSGINFALYFRLVRRSFARVVRDSELRAYLAFYVIATGVVVLSLSRAGTYSTPGEATRHGACQGATLMTSTGFATADYTLWPGLSRGVLLVMLFVGGCVGSTSGGIKMLHVVVMGKVLARYLKRMVHPRSVLTARLNGVPIDADLERTVSIFLSLYVAVVLVSTVVVASADVSLETALTATLAAIGNIGPGFDRVGPSQTFAFLPDYVKYWLSAVMVAGRLELFTVLVLFYPGFFRRW